MLAKNTSFPHHLIICLVLFWATSSFSHWLNTIQQADVIVFADHTHIAITSDQKIHCRHFMLSNPLRLVVDFDETKLSRNDLLPPSIQAPYLNEIRLAQFTPNTVRLVISLKTQVTLKIGSVSSPRQAAQQQLNIDLYPTEHHSSVKAVATVSQKPVPAQSTLPKPFIIMIDPGHGGQDSGAIGVSGTQEKEVVLAIAKALKKILALDPHIQVHLTREEDIYIPLSTRVLKAREKHADLFVSIHADAFTKPHAHGSSVYALSEKGATSTAAALLAKNQNNVDRIIGISVDHVNLQVRHTLLDLVQTATIHNSLKLGKQVLDQLEEINALHKPYIEQAGFAVLKAPDIPSILVETAFITNPEEEKRLINKDFQLKIAKAISRGIQEYIKVFKKNR